MEPPETDLERSYTRPVSRMDPASTYVLLQEVAEECQKH